MATSRPSLGCEPSCRRSRPVCDRLNCWRRSGMASGPMARNEGGLKTSRYNAIEMGDVIRGLPELRYPFETGAVLLGDRGRARQVAAIADRGAVGVAFEQEGLFGA